MYRTLYVRPSHRTTPDIQDERTTSSVSKEGRGYRRGEPSDIATLRWFPSPKDLHVLNPKRFFNACLRQVKEALNLATVLKSFKQSFSPVPALPANCHTDSKCLTTFHEVKKVRMNHRKEYVFSLWG